MAIETKEDVNERFPSGYYFYTENGKDKLISGIDHTIRELNGKELTKIPSVIICTKNKNGSSYSSNRDRPVNSFGTIQSHYKKVIDKKDYSYDFSKFYYIENEGGEGPSKVVLHNKDFDYNGYKYENGNLVKKTSGALNKAVLGNTQITKFINVEKTSFSEFDGIDKYFVEVTNGSDNNLLFTKGSGGSDDTKIYVLLKIKTVYDKKEGQTSECQICFYFNNSVIKNSLIFPSNNDTDINVSVNYKYSKQIKEIGTIIKPENCQYGIYRLRNNGNLYDANKYIVLKFDELAALPTNITDFYTRKPTGNYGDPAAVATLLNNPMGSNPGDSEPNIIAPTETITEIYVIKSY